MAFLYRSVMKDVRNMEMRRPRMVMCGLWKRLGDWEGKMRVVDIRRMRKGRRPE